MSIEKDVAKLYKGDIEKQKKNQKKKKKKRLVTLLFVIIFIAAVILLMRYLGIGFGGGKGEGGESSGSDKSVSSSVSDESQTSSQTTTPAVPKEYIGIKVSGSTYLYQGSEITLDNLTETIRLMSDNVVVLITDDNATKNAMDALTSAFDKTKREYLIESAATESGADVSAADNTDSAAQSATATTLVP